MDNTNLLKVSYQFFNVFYLYKSTKMPHGDFGQPNKIILKTAKESYGRLNVCANPFIHLRSCEICLIIRHLKKSCFAENFLQ